jgi:hypothetical protein
VVGLAAATKSAGRCSASRRYLSINAPRRRTCGKPDTLGSHMALIRANGIDVHYTVEAPGRR